MLYVAIWYVSIRPVVMRVKEELECPIEVYCTIGKNNSFTITVIMTRSDRNGRYIRTSAERGLILQAGLHLREGLGLCQCND